MDKEDIAQKILNYLQINPEAGDTVEGIARWWLQFEKINHSVDKVSEGLEVLLQKGFVTRHEVRGGAVYYRFAKRLDGGKA